jgi:porphobilinogen synthase
MTQPSPKPALVDLPRRPRRLRRNPALRGLVREHRVHTDDLIQPLFLKSEGEPEPIPSMPGMSRLNPKDLIETILKGFELGIRAYALFPALTDEFKDSVATEGSNPSGLLPTTLKAIKTACPDVLLITDVAMDPYSSDGHDGYVENGEILNDETLTVLGDMAVCQAKAGADLVAPSDMMDGRVGYIRDRLDEAGFQHVGILAYSAKYASAFYGPFRDALDSAPRGGDKKTYQMDPANVKEALVEIELDLAEGADLVMVKPGLPYLDVIRYLRDRIEHPIAAYHVSGEYAMTKAAAEKGWIDERAVVEESLLAFKRAGTDMILSYYALEWAQWQKD